MFNKKYLILFLLAITIQDSYSKTTSINIQNPFSKKPSNKEKNADLLAKWLLINPFVDNALHSEGEVDIDGFCHFYISQDFMNPVIISMGKNRCASFFLAKAFTDQFDFNFVLKSQTNEYKILSADANFSSNRGTIFAIGFSTKKIILNNVQEVGSNVELQKSLAWDDYKNNLWQSDRCRLIDYFNIKLFCFNEIIKKIPSPKPSDRMSGEKETLKEENLSYFIPMLVPIIFYEKNVTTHIAQANGDSLMQNPYKFIVDRNIPFIDTSDQQFLGLGEGRFCDPKSNLLAYYQGGKTAPKVYWCIDKVEEMYGDKKTFKSASIRFSIGVSIYHEALHYYASHACGTQDNTLNSVYAANAIHAYELAKDTRLFFSDRMVLYNEGEFRKDSGFCGPEKDNIVKAVEAFRENPSEVQSENPSNPNHASPISPEPSVTPSAMPSNSNELDDPN